MLPQRRKTKNKTNGVLLIVVIALVLILAAAVVVAVTLGNQPAPSQPQTATTEPTQEPTETDPPLSGWQMFGGYTYYYVDGVPQTGAFTVDSKIYVADENGVRYDAGWVEYDGKHYLLNEDCVATTGWYEENGKKYYFKEDGSAATGTLEIDGRNYFFSSQGVSFLVVNPWNQIPGDHPIDLVALPSGIATSGQQVDRSCYDALMQMISECNAALKGVARACVLSSYRTISKQVTLFNNKVNRVLAANPGLTRQQAEIEAAKVVAIPGTSEHHTGLAVDIIDTKLWALEEEQEDLPAQKWLMENCWRYGFILRYPKNTTDSTGIIYEPWHYRYLGVELATEIHHSGMTVEQYLASLTEPAG